MTKVAIASCCKVQMQNEQPAWADIEAENPDFVLLLGDNAYMRNSRWDHDGLEKRYQQQFAEPNFKSLTDNVPYMAIWDDHDFGVNDSRGAEISHWKREKSRKLFHEYMGGAINDNRPEVYCSHEIDDIKVIMLDVRYYRQRAHPSRPWATLLGGEQEEWLWRQLDHNKKYTLIGSGTCIRDGADRETYRDFKNFYGKFKEELAKRERVLFVSGDIHRNKFRTHSLGDGKKFHEAISSGIGRKETLGSWPRIRYGDPLNNYGIINFGSTRVNVSLRGRKSNHQIDKTIRSSSWDLV